MPKKPEVTEEPPMRRGPDPEPEVTPGMGGGLGAAPEKEEPKDE